jgi:WD40 repeat protein
MLSGVVKEERRGKVHNFFPAYETIHLGRHLTNNESAPEYSTADFYSDAKDVTRFRRPNLPFCTAACNTNSVIAVGTESGGVWLYDTEDNANMSDPIVRFWAHKNAVMDMQFSSDDLTLATSSGDQTARLIDVRTQQVKALFELHFASVKQVRFQPGDENVLATCSREGLIALWDIRCRGDDRPIERIVMSPSGELDDTQTTTARLYTEPLHAIPRAHMERQPQVSKSRAPPTR